MDGFHSAARPVFLGQVCPTGLMINDSINNQEVVGVLLTGATVCQGRICFSVKLILYLAGTKLAWEDPSRTNRLRW